MYQTNKKDERCSREVTQNLAIETVVSINKVFPVKIEFLRITPLHLYEQNDTRTNARKTIRAVVEKNVNAVARSSGRPIFTDKQYF